MACDESGSIGLRSLRIVVLAVRASLGHFKVAERRHWKPSNRNPLHFIKRDFVPSAVVELGGGRAFMRRHKLGVFQRAAGLQMGRDSGGPDTPPADRGCDRPNIGREHQDISPR